MKWIELAIGFLMEKAAQGAMHIDLHALEAGGIMVAGAGLSALLLKQRRVRPQPRHSSLSA